MASTMTDPSSKVSNHRMTVFIRTKYNQHVSNPVSKTVSSVCIWVCDIYLRILLRFFLKILTDTNFFPPESVNLAYFAFLEL